jgi:4,5:9,10-diseco-3-hydroxy-5,9,17-trioxoandrosta-1(10),2-diene-4-oate hydrolase
LAGEAITTTQTGPVEAGLEDKFVTLPDGVRVRYQEAGPPDAPPVLLMHGFLGSVRDWRFNTGPLAELALAKGHPLRVIALDWVGFGASSKPKVAYSLFYFADFLKKFADALNLRHLNLIGHSMGGKHNLAFAILYPDYVEKLVLVDTDGFVADPWWIYQTGKVWFRPLGKLSAALLGKPWFLRLTVKNILHDPKFYPGEAEVARAAEELRDPEYKAALQALNQNYPQLSLKLTGLRARLPELKVPVQIFWGLQDRLISLDCAHIAQAEIPGAHLYVFDQCSHLPQIEKAEEFNRLTLDFLLKS